MFLDLGSKRGSRLKWLERYFGCKGISVDLRRDQLRKARGDKVVADIRLPIVQPKSVDYISLIHVLEHLESLDDVFKVLKLSIESAKKQIYIRGPWFDADDYLKELGFNLFWSSWKSYRTHLTSTQLTELLVSLHIKNFTVGGTGGTVVDSLSPRIHPIGYLAGHNYTRGIYPKKDFVKFNIPIYDELLCKIEL